jgi:hypothetical protein
VPAAYQQQREGFSKWRIGYEVDFEGQATEQKIEGVSNMS